MRSADRWWARREERLCPPYDALRSMTPSAAREVAMLQAERLDCRLRKSAPRFDLLIRRHHCRNHCGGLLRILFGHKVDRADGRTAVQWLSCHQYDLTICHTPLYHHRCPRYL